MGCAEGIYRDRDEVNLHAKWNDISCMHTDNTIKKISSKYCFQWTILSCFELIKKDIVEIGIF